MDQNSKRESYQNLSLQALFVLLFIVSIAGSFGWIISGIFHEFGHTLTVWAFGGVITDLQPLVLFGAPHIAYIGSFTEIQKAIISISGAGFVFLIGILALKVFTFEKVNPTVRLSLAIGIVPFIAQLISFIILPILHLLGMIIHDDVITFTKLSKLNPFWISLIASMIAILGVLIFIRHTRISPTIQAITAK